MKKDINIFRFYQELATSLRKNHKNFNGICVLTENFYHFYEMASNFFEFEYERGNWITSYKVTEESIFKGIIHLYLYEAKKGMEAIIGYEKITIDYLKDTFKLIVKEIYRIFEIEALNVNKESYILLTREVQDYHNSFNKNKYRRLKIDNLIKKYIK